MNFYIAASVFSWNNPQTAGITALVLLGIIAVLFVAFKLLKPKFCKSSTETLEVSAPRDVTVESVCTKDTVNEGDVVLTVVSGTERGELLSPATGKLWIKVEVGSIAKQGDILFVIAK
ncbi:MAG: hypothetical protein RR998_06620 [Oscillospiraceae bacterium]